MAKNSGVESSSNATDGSFVLFLSGQDTDPVFQFTSITLGAPDTVTLTVDADLTFSPTETPALLELSIIGGPASAPSILSTETFPVNDAADGESAYQPFTITLEPGEAAAGTTLGVAINNVETERDNFWASATCV